MNINRGFKIIHPNGEEKARFFPLMNLGGQSFTFTMSDVRWSLSKKISRIFPPEKD